MRLDNSCGSQNEPRLELPHNGGKLYSDNSSPNFWGFRNQFKNFMLLSIPTFLFDIFAMLSESEKLRLTSH